MAPREKPPGKDLRRTIDEDGNERLEWVNVDQHEEAQRARQRQNRRLEVILRDAIEEREQRELERAARVRERRTAHNNRVNGLTEEQVQAQIETWAERGIVNRVDIEEQLRNLHIIARPVNDPTVRGHLQMVTILNTARRYQRAGGEAEVVINNQVLGSNGSLTIVWDTEAYLEGVESDNPPTEVNFDGLTRAEINYVLPEFDITPEQFHLQPIHLAEIEWEMDNAEPGGLLDIEY